MNFRRRKLDRYVYTSYMSFNLCGNDGNNYNACEGGGWPPVQGKWKLSVGFGQ